FSSRRRHTRFSRDWSSDVCSSDLCTAQMLSIPVDTYARLVQDAQIKHYQDTLITELRNHVVLLRNDNTRIRTDYGNMIGSLYLRSEERRVGKECRCLWGEYY